MIEIPDLPGPLQDQQLLDPVKVGPPPHRRRPSGRGKKRRSSLAGPMRALRLCLLCVVVPASLVSVPLYLRYRVYNRQEYPASVSDMRMINAHVSTTWCQSQLVRANATFNAYVVSGTPSVNAEPKSVSMSRQLVLEDDMKEYWAFYLLKGSTVTVSTCVRWQGASLIIIKGHKHLRECAYIGDDSSEEEDELLEELQEAEAREEAAAGKGKADSASDDDTNTPQLMRRAGPGVLLHRLQQPLSSKEQLRKDYSDDTSEEQDTILARVLLRKATDQARMKAKSKHAYPISDLANSSNQKNSSADLGIRTTPPTSLEVFEEVLKSLKLLGPRGKAVLQKLNLQLGENGDKELHQKIRGLLEDGNGGNKGVSNETAQSFNINLDVNGTLKVPTDEKVLLEDGKGATEESTLVTTTENTESETRAEEGGITSKSSDANDGENKTTEDDSTRTKRRRGRDITFGGANLHELFNKHDLEDDKGIEEDLEPDGIAVHHRTLNQTTKGDHSNSEFWSSFSSSEEALLQCAGLVLNLPLTPHRHCSKHRSAGDHATASLPNTITYKVSSTGYYFFVFSSENEIQPNYFRVHFHLEKTMYNVSNAMAECKNTTADCSLPLGFWSYDTVVLELPVGADDSAWSEDFVVTSTCEPRTAVYLVCILSVPLFILLCSLH